MSSVFSKSAIWDCYGTVGNAQSATLQASASLSIRFLKRQFCPKCSNSCNEWIVLNSCFQKTKGKNTKQLFDGEHVFALWYACSRPCKTQILVLNEL